ncbi:MAG TPA: hypothetical protein ENH15_00550 [Actinobacteria bacterium]|nr:hypothetical protein [Actinomycetota bacterium]
MNTETASDRHDDSGVAPELAALNLPDKPDGPAAAAMFSAGVGIATLGVLTTLAVISSWVKEFLRWWEWGQGVGPLAGKTTIAVVVWLVTWAVLNRLWREKDVDLKAYFYGGLALGIVGIIGTFPPFFEAFE